MVTYGGAKKEWFEQADIFETLVAGKTLDEVKKRVKDFKSLQSKVNTVMSDIDNTYGNLIDERTKESIAFVYLAKDNMMERLTSREEIIKGALSNDIVANSERSTLTDEQKAVVAEYGSVENALQMLKALKAAKAHRTDIKKVNKAISTFRSIKDNSTLLSAADILALGPVERASIFATAFGVAPIPNPQLADENTAAS